MSTVIGTQSFESTEAFTMSSTSSNQASNGDEFVAPLERGYIGRDAAVIAVEPANQLWQSHLGWSRRLPRTSLLEAGLQYGERVRASERGSLCFQRLPLPQYRFFRSSFPCIVKGVVRSKDRVDDK